MDGVHRKQFELTGIALPRRMSQKELSCLFAMSKKMCFYSMIAGTIVIVYISSLRTGWDAFKVVFLGSILDIVFGLYVAYNIGIAFENRVV